jgi:hypothetical protein
MRPSAEQAVKVPCQPMQRSSASDSAKRDDNSVSSMFPVSPHFHLITRDFLHLESAQAPRMTTDSTVCTCALMHRDDSKFQNLKKNSLQWPSSANLF